MYHSGQRRLQDEFASAPLADRLYERLRHDRFTDADKAFIEALPFFFLATADAEGRPDCSYKGGDPGFVRILAPDRLVFPDYDGNGMFRSLGNVEVNPHVGLLFLGVGPKQARLRVNGAARVLRDDPRMAQWPGAQLLVEVSPRDIFPNCPRYIPELELKAPSPYVPRADAPPLEPAWKSFSIFSDVVPPRR
ncbi:pyridoxamine 5'-phosphate oxidase family protein [Phenylobacterium sp. NIBR 498073]|uniref:pyridoxamine 5'-phosphate oxidase family protein n=1 Tax=Phenylobacterium sp. NIBR 498073 TaxID=3015177 RepID=UPI0022B400F1|nr:pyridoxamine 5'-phosphate oxidase family protein [Phenylobacterium sp. NIBR 498073]WGU41806.1 pyridoxamine 5'-phosphate oxidase family protein [Phenylobacterium sp. NIBR 498073]